MVRELEQLVDQRVVRGTMNRSAAAAVTGSDSRCRFEVICEVEPPTRPDLTRVRHQIGVLSHVADSFLVPDNHIGRATVSRRVRVTGKGGKERVVPVDAAFFAELAAYLREERPAACRTAECFVVLRGPTAGRPLTEAGLRRVFRTHRLASGALRVRPHRLRHVWGPSSPRLASTCWHCGS